MPNTRAGLSASLTRSPVARAVYSSTAFIGGAVLTFGAGPKWHSTKSLIYLSELMGVLRHPHPGILRGWGVLLMAYALVIVLVRSWRPIAYACGMGVWTIATIGILRTLPGNDPSNILVPVAFVSMIGANWLNMRLTQADIAGLGDLDRP